MPKKMGADEYEIYDVNYWVESKDRIQDVIQETDRLMLLISATSEFRDMVDLINAIPQIHNVAYFSLNKTYDAIKPDLGRLKTTPLIVDCISNAIFKKEDTAECIYLDPPGDLHGIIEAVRNVCYKKNPGIVLIDNISAYTNLDPAATEQESTFLFSTRMREILDKHMARAIVVYNERISMPVKALPKQHFDRIVRMEILEGRVNWQG